MSCFELFCDRILENGHGINEILDEYGRLLQQISEMGDDKKLKQFLKSPSCNRVERRMAEAHRRVLKSLDRDSDFS